MPLSIMTTFYKLCLGITAACLCLIPTAGTPSVIERCEIKPARMVDVNRFGDYAAISVQIPEQCR